jgi:hypothetical protein
MLQNYTKKSMLHQISKTDIEFFNDTELFKQVIISSFIAEFKKYIHYVFR